MMKYKIAWEKYEHPLFTNDEEEDDTDDKYKDSYGEDKENYMGNMFMGGVPLFNPYKEFNLWTGHTTFPLTKGIVNEISIVNGVETLQILTPYRMRIGVGKLFKSQDVRFSITKLLNTLTNPSGETV